MEEKNETNKLSTASAIIVAGLLIAGGLFFGLNSGGSIEKNNNTKPQAQEKTGQNVDIAKVNIKGSPFIGNPDAPITIAYWSDYQCPFCKRFNKDALSKTIKDYVSTGKVKIVFKDFQFLGPDSNIAGLIGRAVWEVSPDKYYIWHEAMYQKQDAENSGWGNKVDILALVKSLGIDEVKVEELIISKADQYKKRIENDRAEGASFGINGTPGTIIGKNVVSGAQPYSVVKQLIDLELKGK